MTPKVGEMHQFYCFYTDPIRGHVWELQNAIVESVNITSTGVCGIAKIPDSGGFDWYEYNGKLCHGRRYAEPTEKNRAYSKK